MKVIAVNGSPRKNKNTATLLKQALDGAASGGAETELIHLYDCNFKGCTSCFACKLKGGASYGKCAWDDDLKPVLGRIASADALLVGSPIYFGMVTGETRSFLERLMFQYLVYDANYTSLFRRKIKTGFIYTMNIPKDRLEIAGYERVLSSLEAPMARTFGSSEALYSMDTWQFDDHSKYETSGIDIGRKNRQRTEVFPEDCRKAFEMGARFAEGGEK